MDFIAAFGDDAFDLAMRSGPMLAGMRRGSKWAFTSALGAYENDVPCVLLTKLNPSTSKRGERVEHRLLSGDAQLVVDFPPSN